jgi:ABC-2 type transport system permease protein
MSTTTATAPAVVLSRRPNLSALAALMAFAIRQDLHGRRLLVLALLFALPSVLIAIIALSNRDAPADVMEFAFIFNLIPHALAPLTALLYAAGLIRDEVEEQTLTYLLMRPLPRPAIYIVKWKAAYLVTAALTAVFTCVAFGVTALTCSEPLATSVVERALITSGILALTQIGYCAVFGAIGLMAKRALLLGVAYIILFEGLLANLDTVARRLTVMYYFRVLNLRWLQPERGRDWGINLDTAPSAESCIWILCGVGLTLVLFCGALFARKEFRVKTPEGN